MLSINDSSIKTPSSEISNCNSVSNKRTIDQKILNFIYENFDFLGTNSQKEKFSEKLAEVDAFFIADPDHRKLNYEKINVLVEHFVTPQSQISTESIENHRLFSEDLRKRLSVWEPDDVREKKRKHLENYDATQIIVRLMRDSLALIFNTSSLIKQFGATSNWKVDSEECRSRLITNLELYKSQMGEETPNFLDKIYQQLGECKNIEEFPKDAFKNFFINGFEYFLKPFIGGLNELIINATAFRNQTLFNRVIESVKNGTPHFFFAGMDHFVSSNTSDRDILEPLYKQLDEKQIHYMILSAARKPKNEASLEQIEEWKIKSVEAVEAEDDFVVYNQPEDAITQDELEKLGVSHLKVSELNENQQNDLFKLKHISYFFEDVLDVPQISMSKRLYDFIDLVIQLNEVCNLMKEEDFLEKSSSDCENENKVGSS